MDDQDCRRRSETPPSARNPAPAATRQPLASWNGCERVDRVTEDWRTLLGTRLYDVGRHDPRREQRYPCRHECRSDRTRHQGPRIRQTRAPGACRFPASTRVKAEELADALAALASERHQVCGRGDGRPPRRARNRSKRELIPSAMASAVRRCEQGVWALARALRASIRATACASARRRTTLWEGAGHGPASPYAER